jgi:hypothetical protein
MNDLHSINIELLLGTSYSASKLVDINDFVSANFKDSDKPVVFVIGAFAHGNWKILGKFH